jgi:hypothetical protein
VAKKRGRALGVGDVLTFEELRAATCRVLGDPKNEPDHSDLLDLAALYLRTFALAEISERDRQWVNRAAEQIGRDLLDMGYQWRAGEVRHLEEALGWKRPKNWRQATEQRRSRHRSGVYVAVTRAMEEGARTPDVFRTVYETGKFPEELSVSIIKQLYYEQKAKQSVRRARTFQKSARKAGKTTRP